MAHVPVLLNEVLDYLNVAKGSKFADATVGSGGHTKAILEKNKSAKVLGIDLDQTSLDKLKKEFIQNGLGQRAVLVQGNYKDIEKIIDETGFGQVDGLLADLGFSSSQLNQADRGFSFQTEGPLDMRFDKIQALTAEEVVNRYYEKDLERILREYGEERLARRIARAIISRRKLEHIKTTGQLAQAVRSAVPLPIRFKANDNIRRVFQAIRIEVNRELENLRKFLPKALKVLNPGGRLAIISFHSLEDRIVKEFFNKEAKDCVCPPEFPTCVCDKASTIKILTRKPIVPTAEEQQNNPRSKSAKLRVAEKIM